MIAPFEIFKNYFFPQKSKLNVQLKFKLPNMTDWHILPRLNINVLIACRLQSVRPQNVECISASDNLQKFAADSTLYTSPKFTAMQNCHNKAKQQPKSASTCTLKSSFKSCSLKIFLFHQIRKLSCSILIYMINLV